MLYKKQSLFFSPTVKACQRAYNAQRRMPPPNASSGAVNAFAGGGNRRCGRNRSACLKKRHSRLTSRSPGCFLFGSAGSVSRPNYPPGPQPQHPNPPSVARGSWGMGREGVKVGSVAVIGPYAIYMRCHWEVTKRGNILKT
jgi:hypothetical protein